MKRRYTMMALLFAVLLAATGCSKSADTSEGAARTAPEATAPDRAVAAPPSAAPSAALPANGAPNAATVAAATNEVPAIGAPANAPTPAAEAAAPAAAPPPAAPVDAETLRKKAQIDWALKQDEIKNDSNGQWAVRATASSTYNDAKGNSPYSPTQVTGAPNIEGYGNSGSAWTPKTPDAGIEWLELEYPKPVQATMVRVRESYGSGAVMKIELFDEKGTPHTVWSGADPTKSLDYLVAEFPRTAFKTARVKVTLATNVVGGANQIDAVQLVGTDK